MPTGVEPIQALVGQGHRVDVLTFHHPDHPVFESSMKGCRVESVPLGRTDGEKLAAVLLNMPARIRACRRRTRYDAVIALSQMGMILAWRYFRRVPIVYLADEIRLEGEGRSAATRWYYHLLKRLEIVANRVAAFSITQDEGRADLLARVNRVPLESILTLPNSRSGKAEHRPSRYLQERFGLPESTVVILSVGMVSSLNCSLELAQEAGRWPADHVLVFHNRYDQSGEPGFQRVRAAADPARVLFSNDPVSFEELDWLVSSAHVGVALYAAVDENHTTMGLSSGKISTCLRNGVPVIAQRFESLEWVEQSHSGVLVSDASEVLAAVRRIRDDYSAYSRAALRAYDERLSFDVAFEPILNRLLAAVGDKSPQQ
jgi:hypothetical protein